MNPRDLFANSYCISLDRRNERWVASRDEFVKQNLHVTRFIGVDGMKVSLSLVESWRSTYPTQLESSIRGKIGCTLSHYGIWKLAIEKGHPYVCVFEDDIHFSRDFWLRMKSLSHLPTDWDAIWLGGRPRATMIPVIHDLYQFKGVIAAHAYIVRDTALPIIMKLVKEKMRIADETLCRDFMPNYNVYGVYPFSIIQRKGFSDLSMRHTDYRGLHPHARIV